MGQTESMATSPTQEEFGDASTCKNTASAAFGAGCYWGTEKYFRKDFAKLFPKAILSTAVGFMGGDDAAKNPTYRQVCSGTSGHVEVLHVEYDADKVSFEDMVKFFYTFHDPTVMNKQGNDAGPQYASAIFVATEEQKKAVVKVTERLQELLTAKTLKLKGRSTKFATDTVETAIRPMNTFYPAHQEHQDYLAKNPNGYCNHRVRFSWEESCKL